MIKLLRIVPAQGGFQDSGSPPIADLEGLFPMIFGDWSGSLELWAQDDWCLVLFADHGRFHLGIVHQEEKAFFLQNLSVPESDRQVDLAWNTVPEDEVVANKDLVRTCLLDFFHTARPSKAATWRELVMEG